MDPKKPTELDPKLKEVYERVMGTPVSPLSTAPSAAPQTPLTTQPAPLESLTPAQTAPTLPQNVQPKTQEQPKPEYQAFTTTPQGVIAKEKSSSKLLSILLVTAAIIFFTIYALFWLRFFNLSLPFLS